MTRRAGDRPMVLWRIVENGRSRWEWRKCTELSPMGPWRVVATRIRGKYYNSLLDDIFSYATADIDGSYEGLPIYCPCGDHSCDGCEVDTKYPIPPCHCRMCDRCVQKKCMDPPLPEFEPEVAWFAGWKGDTGYGSALVAAVHEKSMVAPTSHPDRYYPGALCTCLQNSGGRNVFWVADSEELAGDWEGHPECHDVSRWLRCHGATALMEVRRAAGTLTLVWAKGVPRG